MSFQTLDRLLVLTSAVVVLWAISFADAQETDSKHIVCYYSSQSAYKTGDGKFEIENIDTDLCTHIIYAFAKLNDTGNVIVSSDPSLDIDKEGYSRFVGLKARNPDMKALLSIGGWMDDSKKYSDLVADQDARKTFIKSVVEFLRENLFDGLDFDWEYPTTRGGNMEDKDNFAYLISELRQAFDEHSLLLTAALSPNKELLDHAYDYLVFCKDLDFINLMMYDFYGFWDNVTGHHTSLYTDLKLGAIANSLNQSMAVYRSAGGCPEKTVLGMGMYGRTYTLEDPSKTDTGSPTTGPGEAGPYSNDKGYLGYNEICALSGYQKDYDEYTMAPWAYKGDQWLAYDNVTSIGIKLEWALSQGLAGGMIWSIDTDDFKGACNQGSYPLLREINRVLRPAPATTTP